jgi:OOP family OmpA-OmpF porin
MTSDLTARSRTARSRTTRAAALAAGAGLALALTACGSSQTFSPAGEASSAPAGGVTIGAGGSGGVTIDGATVDPGATVTDGAGGDAVALPEFPAPRVPDLTSMTGKAATVQKAVAKEVQLPPGVEVTGARCAADGSIVNRSGVTVGGGDDGSQVVSRAGVSQVNGNGSGQVSTGDTVYQVNSDGSGQVSTGAGVLQVNSDRSGQFTFGDTVYQVNSDGSGQVTTATEVYQVEADGSGSWTSDDIGVVNNNGDGSGSWIGPKGVLEVTGDGTGTLDGAPVQIAAMPKFALLGKLPRLNKLKPLGKPCGTLIRISAGVLFDFDKDAVRPEAKDVLTAVAKALGKQTVDIQVNGHTDAKGSDAYNQDLSERRATAVVTFLEEAGLKAPLEAQGFGETQPVAPNTLKGKDNPAGRQLNRRVEIVIPNS